jgi:rhodanese-related sulfurtransferase
MNQGTGAPASDRSRNWPWLAVVVLLAAGLLTALLWKRPATKIALPQEISVAEAVAKQEQGIFLLDVREPDEWAAGHVSGSTLIPLGELEGRVAEVPRDREIVVICRSGNRSRHGRDVLLAAGHTRVASMAGGLLAWKAEGHPTVTGP